MEFAEAWSTLRQEAQKCSVYLGQDITGSLAIEAESAGQGATDGSTRRKITAETEELRGAVMNEAISRMTNSKARAAVAWHNRDKLSSVFPATHDQKG